MSTSQPLQNIRTAIDAAASAANRAPPRLLAVSKRQPVEAIRALAAQGQHAFGENYVQEAMAKREQLADLDLEWHLIGHLQSNKAAEAARTFDWVQTIDRLKLVDALARRRPPELAPLNVLIQVNIDDEASKHGCSPDQIETLAIAIVAQPRLHLRGLMAIPAPDPHLERRAQAFSRMHTLFERLREGHPDVDTLSMGMSEDFVLAISEGASMIRIGTALFGARPDRQC